MGRNKLLLDIQPENEEPIEFTHFDCWPNPAKWDAPENLAFVKNLFKEWAVHFNLPKLRGLSARYLKFGQIFMFKLCALEFLNEGYRVFDGDECFEVYSKPVKHKRSEVLADLDTVIASCNEGITGEWDCSTEGFEAMIEALERVKAFILAK